jgi:hypothetical protein
MTRASGLGRCHAASPLPRRRRVNLSYAPPWAHYLGGYQDRLLGGPLRLLDLGHTVPDGVRCKDYGGEYHVENS